MLSRLLSKAVQKAQELPEEIQDELAEQFIEDIENEIKWQETLSKPQDSLILKELAQKAIADSENGQTEEMGFGQFKSELHHCLIYLYRIPHSGYDSQDIFEDDC
jgi:hypothetical protein